ncbi:hypothetical protein AB0C76_15515 [Kitasatospora sp. NPDC048722]|uniref:hypothetical protein n=1 Tax=Kitasatospora sp. NPDC048722 TaxID=3155639 RepID=UPI0033D47896
MVGGDITRQRRIWATGDHDEHPGRRALRQQRRDAAVLVQAVLVQAVDYQKKALPPLTAGLSGRVEQFGKGPGPDAGAKGIFTLLDSAVNMRWETPAASHRAFKAPLNFFMAGPGSATATS